MIFQNFRNKLKNNRQRFVSRPMGTARGIALVRVERRWCLSGFVALLASGISRLAFAESAPPAGGVEEVKGTAIAQLANEKRDLAKNDSVFVGDNVSTGEEARLALRLGRDTKLRMGEKARIKIDRFLVNSGGTITLDNGPLLIEKSADSTERPVQVRSAFGLITVRGTILFAGPSQGVFGVLVTRGEVMVTAGGREVLLRAGEGTSIASPGAPPTPPTFWGEQRVRDALASVE